MLPPPQDQPDFEPRTQQAPAWHRYVAAVARHKWIVLGVTVLGTALGVVAMKFVKPEYLAQGTIWIEVGNQGTSSQGPIRSGQLLESFAWLELLRSYAVLDHVVQSQRLWLQAEPPEVEKALAGLELADRFRPGAYRIRAEETGDTLILATADGMEVDRAAVGEQIGEQVGFSWRPTAKEVPPRKEIKFTILNPRDVARQLGEQLETRMAPEGNFLGLGLKGTDPDEVTNTLNAVADRYVEVAAQLKRAKLDELTEVLAGQRQYAEENLRDAEISLESFRVNTITLPSEDAAPVASGLQLTRDPVFQSFFEMRTQRDELRRDREAIRTLLTQATDSGFPVTALSFVSAAKASPDLTRAMAEHTEKQAQLRMLRERYTEEYAPLQKVREEIQILESSTLPQLAGALASQLAAQEAELTRRIDSASEELREIPKRSIEETRLERNLSVADNLHGTLRQRFEEARLSAASSIPDVRILDRAARPYDPVDDPRPMMVAFGFLGGLGISVLGVILLDRVDRRVRYPDQVTYEMGLPVLGAIPYMGGPKSAPGEGAVTDVAEALREIRLGLLHAYGSAGPLVLTISSPESGDGKSFVASNLALSFADQGYRTLLIDGDIRRGDLHHLLGTQRTPGLTDFLSGTASHADVIQKTGYRSLFVIGSGKRMRGGPELLGSNEMAALMGELKSYFQVILIDTAPLGAGVDPFVLSTLTGNLLMVIRTGSTDRQLAEARLAMLDRLPVRVLGAVLNAVPRSRIYRYYSYLPGYEALDEAPVSGGVAALASGAQHVIQ